MANESSNIEGECLGIDENGFLPFASFTCLKALFNEWQVEMQKNPKSIIAPVIVKKAQEAGFDQEGVSNQQLNSYQAVIAAMLAGPVPGLSDNDSYVGVCRPFTHDNIISSQKFNDLEILSFNVREINCMKIMLAYSLILKEIYGIDIGYTLPRMTIKGKVPGKNEPLYFIIKLDHSHVEIKKHGGPDILPQQLQSDLYKNMDKLDFWFQNLPVEHFSFHGFSIINFVEVTEHQLVSDIKQELIDPESIIFNEKFRFLEQCFRELVNIRDLDLAITAFLPMGGNKWEVIRFTNEELDGDHSSLISRAFHYPMEEFYDSVYCRTSTRGKMLVWDNLKKKDELCGVDHWLLEKGIKGITVAPLYYKEKKVGFLDLSLKRAGQMNLLKMLKCVEVLDQFGVAVHSLVEKFAHEVESVVRKQCTAIHPSVDWRFYNAAAKIHSANDPIMEPITFHKVFPLFAMSDIRSSSTLRARSIQTDLKEQLTLAMNILRTAMEKNDMEFLQEQIYRADCFYKRIDNELHAGDEITIVQYIREELEPVFSSLEGFSDKVGRLVKEYNIRLSPENNMIYDRRKAFEDSVGALNRELCRVLDREEARAQKIFPHYFEKQSTDGVDFSIYIGEELSLEKFDPMYLYNLKLWQFSTICKLEKAAQKIQNTLEIPLELAHLIVIQNNPISINFDYEEKKFGVEGAYNIRYEIMKKRIDKAVVKNTGERLTQPSHIAIVYSQESERIEYERYIEFLASKKLLELKVDRLDLEDLQGIHGLKALRAKIKI